MHLANKGIRRSYIVIFLYMFPAFIYIAVYENNPTIKLLPSFFFKSKFEYMYASNIYESYLMSLILFCCQVTEIKIAYIISECLQIGKQFCIFSNNNLKSKLFTYTRDEILVPEDFIK